MSTVENLNSFFPSRKKLGYFVYQSYALPVYEWSEKAIYPDKRIMCAILKKMAEVFNQSTKILVIRFDLHVKEFSDDNKIISSFNDHIKKIFACEYPNTNAHLIWVREHNKASKQHYHCAILVDGQRVNHPGKLNKLLENAWNIVSEGHFSLPKNCYYLWRHGDNNMLGKIIYRLSYMAKNITKKRFNTHTKRYGISCLNKTKNPHKKEKIKNLPIKM